jgi:RHS repeat-associated protein
VTFGYSIEDRITSQKQGTLQTDYSYDANGHRYQDKVNGLTQVTRHYSDESDNPAWVTRGPANAITQTDVYTPSLGASLNVTRTTKTATAAYVNLANLHGDTITSLQIPSSGYVSAPNNLNVFDEYGINQPLDPSNLPAGPTYTDSRNLFINNYGSLGQAQRETTDTGIQFMGARGYNPITGQFLSPDPIRGGNETPYNYPNDPINKTDLTGLMEKWQTFIATLVISAIAFALVGAICAATAGVGCLVSGLIINGIAGLTTGAIGADNLGYTGSHRTQYMLESGALSSVSSGFGYTAARGAGLTALKHRSVLHFYAKRKPVTRKVIREGFGEANSQATQLMLDVARNSIR